MDCEICLDLTLQSCVYHNIGETATSGHGAGCPAAIAKWWRMDVGKALAFGLSSCPSWTLPTFVPRLDLTAMRQLLSVQGQGIGSVGIGPRLELHGEVCERGALYRT